MIQELKNWCKANEDSIFMVEKSNCICFGVLSNKFRLLAEFKCLKAYNHMIEFETLESGNYFIGVQI